MGKRSKLVATLALVFLVGLAWLALRPREPVYGGKPVSYWLGQLRFIPAESIVGPNGITGIRTYQNPKLDARAVPFLVAALDRKEGAIGKLYSRGRNRLPRSLQKLLPKPVPLSLVQLNAALALGNLGPEAAPAIPSLIRELKTNQDPNMRLISCIGLSKIAGRDSRVKEALMLATHDTNSAVRMQAQLLLNSFDF